MKKKIHSIVIRRINPIVEGVMRWPGSLDILVFMTAFGLYLKTLSPSIYTFDSAELATGVYALGIVHNTGYPLYLMLAKLFTLIIPVGDIAYRVNMFSALCASLCLVFTRRVALIVSGSASAAILGTAMLGVSYPLWSESVVAEVYTLHILFLSAILWLALRWRAGAGDNYLIALGLTLGLSFGNHMATILNIPGIAFFVWDTLKRGRTTITHTRTWIIAGAVFLISLSTYLYLPVRYFANPASNFAGEVGLDLSNLPGVLAYMGGATLTHVYFGYELLEIPGQILNFIALVWETFLGFGLILALIGLWGSWNRDRTTTISLGLIFTAVAVFYINYYVFDKNTMFLPVFLVLSLWISTGIREIQDRLAAIKFKHIVIWSSLGFIILMLILNYPRVDLSDNWITRQFAEEVLQEVPPDSLIFGHWVDLTPLAYLRVVEGQRPDVILFDYSVYTLRRFTELQAAGFSKETTWQITKNEIYQVVEDHLATGQKAFSLGDNEILENNFNQEPVTEWLYAITPVNGYDRLRP